MNDYRRLVRETIIGEKNISDYTEDKKINPYDFAVAIKLFTQIALEAAHCVGNSMDNDVSNDIEELKSVDKVKKFIKNNAFCFIKICQSGFPFAYLEKAASQNALKMTLEFKNDSILYSYMRSCKSWMNKDELDGYFGNLYPYFEMDKIKEACVEFKRHYIENKDLKAGYYLLWLIRKVGECNYQIPEKDFFKEDTVAEVLNNFLAGNAWIGKVVNFIELLHFAEWKNKTVIITELLQNNSFQMKWNLARQLAASKDVETAEIGKHLVSILNDDYFYRVIQHFDSLKKLIPHVSETDFEMIFGRPLIKLCRDKSRHYTDDPSFVNRLIFEDPSNIFVHDSFMVGVLGRYESHHLLCFDMKSQKLLGRIDLKENYQLQKAGDFVSLCYPGEKSAHLIDLKTGKVACTFELPVVPNAIDPRRKWDEFYVSNEKFAYQIVTMSGRSTLIVGKIIDDKWISSFLILTPPGSILPLSTHCGFEDFVLEETFTLVGPTGDKKTFTNCFSAHAHGDKLYLIEKDPDNQDKCYLTIRTLKTDADVVSGVEAAISLNVEKASIKQYCQNGLLVLFGSPKEKKPCFVPKEIPIFIDLKTEKTIYSKHLIDELGTRSIVKRINGEIWTWHSRNHEIRKISPTGMTPMGSLKAQRADFLHIDDNDQLYII